MLDSLSVAEFFRLEFCDNSFSKKSVLKIHSAINWLNVFTDDTNGEVPNLGANDGAMLIPLSGADYRDFRPTVQLASALFYGGKYYLKEGKFNQPLKLLSLSADNPLLQPDNNIDFPNGGYVRLSKDETRLFLRYPKFRFRPSHCDVLHIDFWLSGKNILRDAGTFSYNTKQFWLNYFPSTAAHNTVQFDGDEQMPRLSRFLYYDWLKTKVHSGLYKSGSSVCYKAGYKKSNNCQHIREVQLKESKLKVIDSVQGFKDKAVLRWHLAPGQYEIKGTSVVADDYVLTINTDLVIKNISLIEGWESKYYMKKTTMPVLEVEVSKSGTINTIIQWSKKVNKL